MIFILGVAILSTSSIFKKLGWITETETDQETETSSLMIKRPTRITIGLKDQIPLVVIILYFGLISSVIFTLFSTCSISLNLQAESVIAFGLAFSGFSLYAAVKGGVSASNSAILSTLMIAGFLVLGLSLPRNCTSEETFIVVQSLLFLVPFSGLFLGSGCGLLTCETLYCVSTIWSSEFKYTSLVIAQGLWSSLCCIIPAARRPLNLLIFTTVFTVLYCFSALILHSRIRARVRLSEKERNLSHGSRATSTWNSRASALTSVREADDSSTDHCPNY